MSETIKMNFMAKSGTSMSTNDRFRIWQHKQWTTADAQASEWYGRGLIMSRRQITRLRMGNIPNGEFLVKLAKAYPLAIHNILFDELQLEKVRQIELAAAEQRGRIAAFKSMGLDYD